MLESVNFDQDRAIDVLLGMSDPNYVSTASHEESVSFSMMYALFNALRQPGDHSISSPISPSTNSSQDNSL